MKRVEQFLKEAGTYYLATVEGDQPRVRPFGTVHIFEDKLYLQTGKVKDVSRQIHAHESRGQVPLTHPGGSCRWSRGNRVP